MFAIVVTAILYFVNTSYEVNTDAAGQKTLIKIDNTTEMDLTAWLAIYQTGAFERIKVINDTTLEGYQPIEKEGNLPLMSLQTDVKVMYYNVLTAQKPQNATLKDLGISLTGETIVMASTEDEDMRSTLFLENILPLIFFLVAALFLFRFL